MPSDLSQWGFLASPRPSACTKRRAVSGSDVMISATPGTMYCRPDNHPGICSAGPDGSAAEHTSRRPFKILGISCSPHMGKNTAVVTNLCLDAVRAVDGRIEIELVELGAWHLPGEVAAGIARDAGKRDIFPGLAAKLALPSVVGIILATPIYYGDMAFLCGAFLDWSAVFHKGKLLANKVAGVLVVGGAKSGEVELTLRWVQSVLISQQMIVVGDAVVSGRRGGTAGPLSGTMYRPGRQPSDDCLQRPGWSWEAGTPAAGTGPAPSIVLDAKNIGTVNNLGRRVAEMALRPDANRPRDVLRLR